MWTEVVGIAEGGVIVSKGGRVGHGVTELDSTGRGRNGWWRRRCNGCDGK